MSAQIATPSGMSGPVDVGGPSKPDSRIFPNSTSDRGDSLGIAGEGPRDNKQHPPPEDYQMRQISNDNDEGVEVVLEGSGKSSVIDSPSRPSQDQNVFRAPHPVRPRAIRGVGHPSSVQHGSGSYGGYGGHPPPPHSHGAPPHGDYRQHPYQSVPYSNSGSFDQQDSNVSSYPGAPPTSQYSPHVQYPPPGGRRPDDLNVISPNHKDHHSSHHSGPRSNPIHAGGPPHHPPLTPSSNGSRYPPQTNSSSYHYPPASPVSRGAGNGASPPRVRGYGMRRPEGPYSAAQRSRDETNGSWGYPTPDRPRPPVVAESSFDSEHHYPSQVSHSSSHPTTPNAPHYGGAPPHHGHYSDPSPPHYGSSAYSGSFDHGNSFDSHHAPYGPPSASPRHGGPGGHYDHDRPSSYYGHSPPSHPPHQAEVSPYSYGYSPGGNGSYYDSYSPHAPHYGRPPPRSYDEHDRYHHHYPYHPQHNQYPHHYPAKKDEKSGILLPKAASEVDFDISDPPLEPCTPASKTPVCESPADVNSYDVLCGRGGGTNSQVGNRRFRKLVQEFQPIYLLARRKEKPLLARTIVLVIRKRGGRFLKKDEETGELYEVGDAKAEAKTSQALREGLDVRATKSAASSLMDKKKKKTSKAQKEANSSASESKKESKDESPKTAPTSPPAPVVKTESQSTPNDSPVKKESHEEKAVVSPACASDALKDIENRDRSSTPTKNRADSPPSLPELNENGSNNSTSATSKSAEDTSPKAPPSPEQMQFRKRRRMRSADGGSEPTTGTCGVTNPFQEDKLFPDFCPPRAHLGRAGSPAPRLSGDDVPHMNMCGMTPIGSSKFDDDDDIRYEEDSNPGTNQPGCAGIALDMMTGAAAGSFCLGPRVWSKRN